MASKTVNCIVSAELVATRPDALLSDCLRIEALNKVVMHPGNQTKINLAVHNSSTDGRMAQVIANYDPRLFMVTVPTSGVYVAGGGKTVIYAMITPLTSAGHAPITFDVF